MSAGGTRLATILDGKAERGVVRNPEPHVDHSTPIFRELALSRNAQQAMLATLDVLSQAVIVLDQRGRPWMMNDAARAILVEGDGLSLSGGELRASRSADRRLRSVIATALDAHTTGGSMGAADLLALERPSGRAALSVRVIPLDVPRPVSPFFSDLQHGAAVLLLCEPDRSSAPLSEPLAACFSLTPRESQVASLLASGGDARDIATKLGISYHTARVHLRTIYEKVGVHDKAALVRLLLQACPGARSEAD